MNAHIPTITKAAQAMIAHDLTLPHALILFACENERPTMTELAQLLRSSTSAITGQCDRMEKLELITRAFDREDRRSVRASITKKGRSIIGCVNDTFEKL